METKTISFQLTHGTAEVCYYVNGYGVYFTVVTKGASPVIHAKSIIEAIKEDNVEIQLWPRHYTFYCLQTRRSNEYREKGYFCLDELSTEYHGAFPFLTWKPIAMSEGEKRLRSEDTIRKVRPLRKHVREAFANFLEEEENEPLPKRDWQPPH